MKFKRFLMFFLLLIAGVVLVGCTGEQGIKGEKGDKGDTGLQGPEGDKGETGDTGAQGATGPKGEQGLKGDKGDQGEPGDEVEFRIYEGVLQQKYTKEDDTKWRDVFVFGDIAIWVSKYTVELDLAGGTLEGSNVLEDLPYKTEVELPQPTKEGFEFKGWSDGTQTYTDKLTIEDDMKLTALWEVAKYTVEFKGEGNLPEAKAYDNMNEFAADLVALFNKYYEQALAENSSAKITIQDDFTGTTHPQVKYVFSDPAVLVEYKWFLDFLADAALEAATDSEVLDTAMTSGGTGKEFVEWIKQIAGGDTEAIKMTGNGAGFRTAFRQLMHKLINVDNANALKGNTSYDAYALEFKLYPEKVKAFLELASTGSLYVHGSTLPTPTYEGHFFDGWYDEAGNKVETVTKDLVVTAKWIKAEDYVVNVTFDLDGGAWADGYTLPETITGATVLPTPVKENYEFLGWYNEAGLKVESLVKDEALTAKWKLLEYEITLDANGGVIVEEYIDMNQFITDIVDLFNGKGAANQSEYETVKQSTFAGNTATNVKLVFAQEKALTEWKWFLEYVSAQMKAELLANGKEETDAWYAETQEMLGKMIAGDTTAVTGPYPYGRTAFRQFIHQLINDGVASGNSYDYYIPRYDQKANMDAFLEFIAKNGYAVENKHASTTEIYTIGSTFETPVKEGFDFLGWFDAEGQKVETAKANVTLTAKWEKSALVKVVVADNTISGGTYITNNENYPNPSFYKDGGLKVNYINQGLLTDKFEAQNLVYTNLKVKALNSNERTDVVDVPAFTVYGLNAAGETVASASLDKIVTGDNVFVLQGDAIVQVKVIFTDYVTDGTTCYNVSVEGLVVDAEVIEVEPEQPEEEQPEVPTLTTVAEIVAAAEKLAADAKLEGTITITGKVTEITAEYSEQYKNISFMLSDGTAEILCFRCKGDDASKLAVGDTITVSGEVQNYKGNTVEFVYAQLTDLVAPARPVVSDKINIFGTEYATLTEAVAAAKEGDIIYVPAGEYADELTVSANNVSICGPNYGVKGNETRAEEAVLTNPVTLADGVKGFVLDGVKVQGSFQLAVGDGCADLAFQNNTIGSTTKDGMVNLQAGSASNITVANNYSEAYASSRFIRAEKGTTIDGLTVTGNDITGTALHYDFINVQGILKGKVAFTNNKHVNSQQSFIYVISVGVIDCTISGNYSEGAAQTIIDFRDMKEDGANKFVIEYNEFVNSGCGWMPIRVRCASYDENDSLTVYVENNKFIESYYDNEGVAEFCRDNAGKQIYVIGRNYYEVNGEALTTVDASNFRQTSVSVAEAYAKAEDVPAQK